MAVWVCNNTDSEYSRSLATILRAAGYDVRTLHATSDLDYRRRDSSIFSRLSRRWNLYVSYSRKLRRAIRSAPAGSVFIVSSGPFFSPYLAGRARAPGVRVINILYDLYPEALHAARALPVGGFCSAQIERLVREGLTRSDATVFIGARIRAFAAAKHGLHAEAPVIAVGPGDAFLQTPAPDPAERAGQIRVLYSGLLGRLHDWKTIAAALKPGVPSDVQIEFRGSGRGYVSLRKNLGESLPHIAWSENAASDAWRAAMLGADVCLVTMRTGAENAVFPSKVFSAIAAGQAVLAVCPLESDLADLVRENDCGWVIEPGDFAALRARLCALPHERAEVLRLRKNAWAAAQKHFSLSVLAEQWRVVLNSVEK